MNTRLKGLFCAILLMFCVCANAAILDTTQVRLVIPVGADHQSVTIGFTDAQSSDLSVSSDVGWASPAISALRDSIEVTFDTSGLISSYTATITLSDDGVESSLFLTADVQVLEPIRMISDSNRGLIYTLHVDGDDLGSLVVYNPYSDEVESCLTLGRRPTDLVISDDGSELFVICKTDETILRINLSDLTISETIVLDVFETHSDSSATANIDLGAGDILYYVDAKWGPILHVYDLSSGTVLQRWDLQDTVIANDFGFGDIAVTGDKQTLIVWGQYGWGAGNAGSRIASFAIQANGTLIKIKENGSLTYPGFRRDPRETPAIVSDDGTIAICKTVAFDPLDPDTVLETFTSEIWSATPDLSLVATDSHIYDYATGVSLLSLPATTQVSAFTVDYSRFAYFDSTDKTLKSINLVDSIDSDAIQLSVSPRSGAVEAEVSQLEWDAVPGVTEYDVYLGTNETDVETAGTSSGLYLGRVSGTSVTLNPSLALGDYYWRVDPLLSVGPISGFVLSFEVAPIGVDSTVVRASTFVGFSGVSVDVDLSSISPSVSWTASSPDPWVDFKANSGSTPSTLEVLLDASNLVAGDYASSVILDAGGQQITILVELEVLPLSITVMKSDRTSSLVYAISEDSPGATSTAFLLEIDSDTEVINRIVEVGQQVTDLAIHYEEEKLYIPNWKSGELKVLDKATLVHERSLAFTGFTSTGYGENDVYRVSAGVSGRIVVEEEDQWIDLTLHNTQTGDTIDRFGTVREGGGDFGPNGRYYYHGESNSSGASFQKFDLAGDTFTELAEIRPAGVGYGSRVVVVSEDGSRIFWASAVFDADANYEWSTPGIVYASTSDGSLAFTSDSVYNINLRRKVLEMPAASTVSAYNSVTEKLVIQNGGEVSFHTITLPYVMAVPDVTVSRTGYTAIVEWTDESLESNFAMQYKEDTSSVWSADLVYSENVTNGSFAVQEGKTYEVRVRAYGTEYSSAWSSIQTLVVPVIPPAVPQLSGSADSATSVRLNLSILSAYDEIVIERKLTVGNWVEIDRLASVSTPFFDSGLIPETLYTYRAKATRLVVESGYSTELSLLTPALQPPSSPSGLSITQINADSGELVWDSVADVDDYIVLRRLQGESQWVRIATVPGDVESYIDQTAVLGSTYDYSVLSTNSIGESSVGSIISLSYLSLIVDLEESFSTDYTGEGWTLSGGSRVLGVADTQTDYILMQSYGSRYIDLPSNDLHLGGRLSFVLRSGGGTMPPFWERPDNGEGVVVEMVASSGVEQLLSIDIQPPNYSDWTQVVVDFQPDPKNEGAHLRIRQLSNSGDNFDVWGLDDVILYLSVPSAPEPTGFVVADGYLDQSIAVLWFSSADSEFYRIERSSDNGQSWQNVGEVYAPECSFVDSTVESGTAYLYRVYCGNLGGESVPVSTQRLIYPLSSMEAWKSENLGVFEDVGEYASRAVGSTGKTNLELYAFHIDPSSGKMLSITGVSDEDRGISVKIEPDAVSEDKYFELQFIRRRSSSNPGVSYKVICSFDLEGPWTAVGSIVDVTVVNEDWEIVTWRDDVSIATTSTRFVRIEILEL